MGSIRSKLNIFCETEEYCCSNTCKNNKSFSNCKLHICDYDKCVNSIYIDKYNLKNGIKYVVYTRYCKLHNCKFKTDIFNNTCENDINCDRHMCYIEDCDILLNTGGGIYCEDHKYLKYTRL